MPNWISKTERTWMRLYKWKIYKKLFFFFKNKYSKFLILLLFKLLGEGSNIMKWVEDATTLDWIPTCVPCPTSLAAHKGKFGNTCIGCGKGLRFDHELEACACKVHGAIMDATEGTCACPDGTSEKKEHGYEWCACPNEDMGEYYDETTG